MLTPADLEFTEEGPRSPRYNDRYYGRIGALEQARTVFLQGCEIVTSWHKQECFCILETGFGLGMNFLASWDAWKADPDRPDRLHFISIECHPIALLQLAQAHRDEPSIAELSRQLRMHLPPAMPGLYRLEFEQGQICLTLVYGQDQVALQSITAEVDAVFLDGFAPDQNPALWSQEVMHLLAQRCKPNAQLSTWCAAAEVRRRLEHAGFEVQRGPGIGSKRETTRARYN